MQHDTVLSNVSQSNCEWHWPWHLKWDKVKCKYTIRKPIGDFLWVGNSNICSVCRRFRDIQSRWPWCPFMCLCGKTLYKLGSLIFDLEKLPPRFESIKLKKHKGNKLTLKTTIELSHVLIDRSVWPEGVIEKKINKKVLISVIRSYCMRGLLPDQRPLLFIAIDIRYAVLALINSVAHRGICLIEIVLVM